ncbi:hypothetical protein GCM10009545_41460 [Saccharopolyspora thermophila]|uniref:Uncharacterized protein n=1 Tax=Saccharopolyspora thermophila TaxID=89367 RepID=A0ABN1D563_9PSEU
MQRMWTQFPADPLGTAYTMGKTMLGWRRGSHGCIGLISPEGWGGKTHDRMTRVGHL